MKAWYCPERQSKAGSVGLRLSEPETRDGEESAWQGWRVNGVVGMDRCGCGGIRPVRCDESVEGTTSAWWSGDRYGDGGVMNEQSIRMANVKGRRVEI